MVVEGVPFKVEDGAGVAVEGGSRCGGEAARAVVAADVDLASAAEECDGEVFGGGFDVLLVSGYGGEAEARVACLSKLIGDGRCRIWGEETRKSTE